MKSETAGAVNLLNARILVGVHSLCAGGTERVVSVLLDEFSRIHGLEVHLLLYGRKPAIFFEIPKSTSVHRPSFVFNPKRRALSTLRTIYFIRHTAKQVKPDVVLNFGEYWNNLILVSTRGLNCPVIVADRSSPAKSLGMMHDFLRKVLYRRASGVLVQTREAAAMIQNLLGVHASIEVIPNPLFSVPKVSTENRALEVLFIGRLIPSKHVDRLIRAFSFARAKGWRLVIVGGDAQGFSEMDALRELVGQLGLEACVEFVGTQKDVAPFLRRASVFAFPSSSEGFPNSLSEALSFGVPSVAYDCSAGPADLIRDGENGFLVPVFDDEAFAGRLSMLMRDQALRERMSAAAIRSVQGLEKSRIASQFLDFALNLRLEESAASPESTAK